MKKFLVNIAMFFAVVGLVDYAAGKAFRFLQANKAGGLTGIEYHVCKEGDEQILVMGSSRASHHYVPNIISNRLGMSCFNAGQENNGVILQYGRWKMILERYAPELVIFDITPKFDMAMNDNMAYMDRLKPFSDDKAVHAYISSFFPLERLKLLSCMYRYNFKFLEIVTDCFRKGDCLREGGYRPLGGHIRKEVIGKTPLAQKKSIECDAAKLHCLEKMLTEAMGVGTKAVLVVSPLWQGGEYAPEAFSPVRELVKKHGIPFFDFLDSPLCYNPDYFNDSVHLNNAGAKAFTAELAAKLQTISVWWQETEENNGNHMGLKAL